MVWGENPPTLFSPVFFLSSLEGVSSAFGRWHRWRCGCGWTVGSRSKVPLGGEYLVLSAWNAGEKDSEEEGRRR